MKANMSLHTRSTPGEGSKGQIFFSFLKVVMLRIKEFLAIRRAISLNERLVLFC